MKTSGLSKFSGQWENLMSEIFIMILVHVIGMRGNKEVKCCCFFKIFRGHTQLSYVVC